VTKAKRKTKLNAQSKLVGDPTMSRISRTLVMRQRIELVRGSFKGKGLVNALMDEKRKERKC